MAFVRGIFCLAIEYYIIANLAYEVHTEKLVFTAILALVIYIYMDVLINNTPALLDLGTVIFTWTLPLFTGRLFPKVKHVIPRS